MTDDNRLPEEKITTLATIAAPWSREVTLQAVDHESGLKILRMRIKEGRARFTIIDLDVPTAKTLADTLLEWAKASEG